MPHYKDGSPAKVGDLVENFPAYPNAVRTLGILVSIAPSDACNGQLLTVARKYPESTWLPFAHAPYPECVTLKECLRVGGEPIAAAA